MTTIADIERARALLHGIAHRTPLLRSSTLSTRVGTQLAVKAEHLQRTGSFKIRGAYVRIASMDPPRPVVAASAGNHAQGVAWAARAHGVACTVVMPTYASLAKIEATRGYGAIVDLHGDTFEDSLLRAREIADSTGATLIHAFDDPDVIAGQGTVGAEICEDAPDAQRVVVPVGGGGLAAGVAVAVKSLRPEIRVIGVRPASSPDTIADGAAVAAFGRHTAPLLASHVDEIIAVDDEVISQAILAHLEVMKQVVEGAGALPLAAMLSGAIEPGGETVLICSGGNIDPGLLMRVIRHGLAEAGRYLFVRIVLEDRPGRLQAVLALLAELKVNVLSVTHHRAGHALPVGGVEVELTVETRDRAHADEVVAALVGAGYQVGR